MGEAWDIAEQVPSSRREWGHKPHFARLICICVVRWPLWCFLSQAFYGLRTVEQGCLVVIILLIAFAAVAVSIDTDECTAGV